jgi:hypothetical protein
MLVFSISFHCCFGCWRRLEPLSRLQVGMPVAVAVSLLGSADAFGLGVCSVRELSIDVMALIICSPF